MARTDESNRTATDDPSGAAPQAEPSADKRPYPEPASGPAAAGHAPKFSDIERRAAELAARLGGAGLSLASAVQSAPRSRPAAQPLPEWPAVEEPASATGERRGKGADRQPRKTQFVAAVIHEDDRDMDQLERLELSPQLDIRRWQRDSLHDFAQAGRGQQPDAALADEGRSRDQEPQPQDTDPRASEVPEAAAPAVSQPEAAATGLPEPDMAMALQDISQFIARQLQAQNTPPADTGAPEGAADGDASPGALIEEPVADRKTQNNLREIERQIRALSAAMSEDRPADAADALGATWPRADDEAAAPGAGEDAEGQPGRAVVAASAEHPDEAEPENSMAPETALLASLFPDEGDENRGEPTVGTTAPELAESEEADVTWLSAEQPDEVTSATLRLLAEEEPETVEPLATGSADTAPMDPVLASRVDSLEAQIVGLLDRVNENEHRLSETLLRESREETRKSLDEAIASSEVFSSLKREMGRLVDTREDYESRTSDALDALHDALKELSERLSEIERSGRAAAAQAEDLSRSSGGIASAVLTARYGSGGSGPRAMTVDPMVPRANASPADDHLPVWLDDGATAGGARRHSYETQADVFQATSELEAEPARGTTVEPMDEASDSPAPLLRPTSGSRPNAAPAAERRREPAVVSAADDAQETTASDDDGNLPYLPAAPQRRADKDADYLRAVRATVAERSAHLVESDAANQGRSPVLGNLLDAARRRDNEAHSDPVVTRGRGRAERREKEGGRFNVLFIATTLVLFVTSAMLLYGMSRKEKTAGGTSQVNAVEDKTRPAPLAPRPKPQNVETPAPEGMGAADKPADGADRRSELDAETQPAGKAASDAKAAVAAAKGGDIEVTASLPAGDRTNSVAAAFNASAVAVGGGTATAKDVAAIEAPREPAPSLPLEIASLSVRTAAQRDDARAQHEIARNYEKGAGVAADPVKAMYWYRRSAHLGYAPSIYRMALAHERGNGVAKSHDKALQLYLLAADKGNINAMHNLGVLYSEGQLGRPDYPQAVRWYGKAAEYGVKDSQVNLAIIHQNGLGVNKNLEEAYKWYFIAAQNGDSEAKAIVADMQADLSIQQRLAIEGKARDWKPSTVSVEANFLPVSVRTYGDVRVVMPSGE